MSWLSVASQLLVTLQLSWLSWSLHCGHHCHCIVVIVVITSQPLWSSHHSHHIMAVVVIMSQLSWSSWSLRSLRYGYCGYHVVSAPYFTCESMHTGGAHILRHTAIHLLVSSVACSFSTDSRHCGCCGHHIPVVTVIVLWSLWLLCHGCHGCCITVIVVIVVIML